MVWSVEREATDHPLGRGEKTQYAQFNSKAAIYEEKPADRFATRGFSDT